MEFSILLYNEPMEFLCFDINMMSCLQFNYLHFFPQILKSKLKMSHVYPVALSSPGTWHRFKSLTWDSLQDFQRTAVTILVRHGSGSC